MASAPPDRHWLKASASLPRRAPRTVPRRAEDEDAGRQLVCVVCGQEVTTTAARISVAGAHEHTFVNPYGLQFHIGCFARVEGCAAVGDRSSYWSWFPAYTWQAEQCGSCREHLGWLFRTDDHQFHGLILDRLVEAEERRRSQ